MLLNPLTLEQKAWVQGYQLVLQLKCFTTLYRTLQVVCPRQQLVNVALVPRETTVSYA